MAAAAAVGIAFAVSLAAGRIGGSGLGSAWDAAGERAPAADSSPFLFLFSLIGPEFVPLVVTLVLGSVLAGTIGLWFWTRDRFGDGGGIGCRLVVAVLVTGLWAIVYTSAGGTALSPLRYHGALLCAVAGGLFLVNWSKIARPDRKTRVSLWQAIMAAGAGWVVAELAEVPSLLPSGLLSGLTLCVNYLSPMKEDLEGVKTERPKARIRARTAPVRRCPAGSAAGRRRKERNWWLLLLLVPFAAGGPPSIAVAAALGLALYAVMRSPDKPARYGEPKRTRVEAEVG
jgi:hypothetical protein